MTLGSWFFWPHDFGLGINKDFLFIYLINPNVKYIHWLFTCNQYFRCNFCVPYEKNIGKILIEFVGIHSFIHSFLLYGSKNLTLGWINLGGGGSGSSFVFFCRVWWKWSKKEMGVLDSRITCSTINKQTNK